MAAPRQSIAPLGWGAHPNDLDRKRIERALTARKRYLYVQPSVLPAADGYRVESPCCSRNVDASGGVIDVALIECRQGTWFLYRKDHRRGAWELHGSYGRLRDLLDPLTVDADRLFWQ
ncbi:hypothetical protein UAJ10_19520 [Nitrospirillum sp. BR 11164]|uniref:DUF3024 domain-containing protein n=1 Tax=Nitrospirillum sp. BR 11164 TaxID=3104324 RepID=UPI002AFFE6BD|nr:hypothetical protein [Nitrospirillum sp. BR 11164]MEA1651203.1 hypothetical protein [Nitrospirillum sp. BR 11164]